MAVFCVMRRMRACMNKTCSLFYTSDIYIYTNGYVV